MDKSAKIFIAGHRGLAGSAIKRRLVSEGYKNFIERTSSELNLTDQATVAAFFAKEKPEYVFVAAAKVGGIHANNTYPAQFMYENLMIQNNVIHNAYLTGVKKLLFLGSSCIYPKMAPQPMEENALLSGYLESTNEAYALAKISGLKMCEYYRKQYGCDFISAMPTNLYGIHDNFDLENSHVLPALLRKFHEAKMNQKPEVVMWGSGSPYREFLYSDDLADALVFLMQNYSGIQHVNVGSGKEITIKELALLIKEVVGYQGEVVLDLSKPDGTPRKIMSDTKMKQMGWEAKTSFKEGIATVYNWYQTSKWCQA